MENVLFWIGTILFIVSFFALLSFNIHMYQINFYNNKTQIKWIVKNLRKIFVKSGILFISLIFIFCGAVGKIIGILLFLLVAYINMPKETKKPLVYTNRVKRLIATAIFISLILIIILKLYNIKDEIILSIMIMLDLLSPLLIILFSIINMPIEKMITKRFIKEAKDIIKNMPNLIVIGITGSYGKTSMKNYLYQFLSTKYNVLMTPGNINTALGVVRIIRENLKATHDIFICEMGADHVGEIKETCDIVKPKYGIITSIGPQHLETFGSIENIIKTKFELADSVPKDGIIFLNYDNEYIFNKKIDKNIISYGINDSKKNMYNGYELSSSSNGLTFKILDENKNEKIINTKLIGNHNIINIVGAIAAANTLGVSIDTLSAKVRQLENVPHRLQLIKGNNSLIIDDSYNSNPSGSKYALDALGTFEGVKILVTPGMIELGPKQYECNYEFGVYATKICDYIILVGKQQTIPIQDGIKSTNYDKNKLLVVDTIQEAMKKTEEINTNIKKIILLENDLPDTY